VTFERWEQAKQDAEEVRLLYVAATRARDKVYMVRGPKGKGSKQEDALVDGLESAVNAGAGICHLTGIPGTRLAFHAGGELLEVEIAEQPAFREVAPSSRFDPSFMKGWAAPPPPPLQAPLEPLTVKEFHDREKGKRFGEKVHAALEAFPPVVSSWPPVNPLPPAVCWGEDEEARWEEIRLKISASDFFKNLCGMSLVGTEVPMLECGNGRSDVDRVDLIVRSPLEHWVVDYKTGRRERSEEEIYSMQVRSYVSSLRKAWKVPVRGFIWYVETGEAVEVREN
jgi:ATP-dependent exoDNAse (exonuclease V) beta subunit